jgi:hypothetical protein
MESGSGTTRGRDDKWVPRVSDSGGRRRRRGPTAAEQADWAESTSELGGWLARAAAGLLREIEQVRRPATAAGLCELGCCGLLGWME